MSHCQAYERDNQIAELEHENNLLRARNERLHRCIDAIVPRLEAVFDASAMPPDLREWIGLAEWQPIETAPKTGKKVILFYLNSDHRPRTVIARWLTDEQAAENDVADLGLKRGWYESIDNWDEFSDLLIHEGNPSHWMPLPAPPIEAIQGITGAK
jgi:hypothetical protein